MKRLFLTLSVLLAGFYFTPPIAFAQTSPYPTPKWHGPACDGWNVCSIDPPDPGEKFGYGCYTSQDQDFVPGKVLIASIGFCQAAKSLLIAPQQDQKAALKTMTYWWNQVLNDIPLSPYETEELSSLKELFTIVPDFDNDWFIYQAHPSAQTWAPVQVDLKNIIDSSEVDG